ncbi:MAG TPA: STM4014 family protein [Ktedonobacterales bacterium]
MWPSASKAPPDFVLIGTPDDRRVACFQAAMDGLGLPPARFVSYFDLLAGRVSLTNLVTPASIVRIESPGKSFEAERAILAFGAEIDDPEGERCERLPREAAEALPFDKGRILPSRQWYLGYRELLRRIASQVSPEQCMNQPDDIALMFDKRACHALLEEHGLPVPPALPPICSYENLLEQMRQRDWTRVFVKLAHGSSASGAVAYRFAGARHQAITTVEIAPQNGTLHLYNTRHIQVYQDQREIAALIDALCRQRVHVEYWIPKAGYANRTFDLRVVTIAGRACHTVARLSHSPMTNLHLLNARGNLAEVEARIGPRRWQEARQTCERAAGLFSSLYMGIDLLFTPDFTRHAILELNAFGDLLPGVLHHEQETYTSEILAALPQMREREAKPRMRVPGTRKRSLPEAREALC